jgi:hypothetical protein
MKQDQVIDISKLIARRDGQREWLKLHYPETFSEQKHLDEGTPERGYWHHGYMMALTDILGFLGVPAQQSAAKQ